MRTQLRKEGSGKGSEGRKDGRSEEKEKKRR